MNPQSTDLTNHYTTDAVHFNVEIYQIAIFLMLTVRSSVMKKLVFLHECETAPSHQLNGIL